MFALAKIQFTHWC